MRYFFLAVLFCAATPMAEAAPFSVNSFYVYETPLVSVIGGLQIGPKPAVVARQTGAFNSFRGEQIGPAAYADVTQSGVVNRAAIVQIGTDSPFISSGQ